MVYRSRLMTHGPGRPGEAHGSWPDAAPALGTQSRAPGPALGPRKIPPRPQLDLALDPKPRPRPWARDNFGRPFLEKYNFSFVTDTVSAVRKDETLTQILSFWARKLASELTPNGTIWLQINF